MNHNFLKIIYFLIFLLFSFPFLSFFLSFSPLLLPYLDTTTSFQWSLSFAILSTRRQLGSVALFSYVREVSQSLVPSSDGRPISSASGEFFFCLRSKALPLIQWAIRDFLVDKYVF
jgi:hypothetical protein